MHTAGTGNSCAGSGLEELPASGLLVALVLLLLLLALAVLVDSRWKLQKMARVNFSIGALYSITKNQDNPIKTVGRDSFLSPKTPKNASF